MTTVKTGYTKKLQDRIISRNRKVVKEIVELTKQEEAEIDKFVKDNTVTEDDDSQ